MGEAGIGDSVLRTAEEHGGRGILKKLLGKKLLCTSPSANAADPHSLPMGIIIDGIAQEIAI